MINKERIEWIDYLKSFACLLVVIGHLLMSLKSIDNYDTITDFIIWFIYLFHMPLFMCISGLLYNRIPKITSLKDYKKFEFKKIVNLLIPYISFYSITIILNMIFSNSVNTPRGMNDWLGIFNNPISPYWFLYSLLSIFIIIPIFEKMFNYNKKKVLILLGIFKMISVFYGPNIFFINSIMKYGFYFYLGTFVNIKEKIYNIYKVFIWAVIYIVMAIIVYNNCTNKIISAVTEFIFSLFGIFIAISIFKIIKKSVILATFKNYTFQIFLMHTIFAAGIRILMFKLGIFNYFIHVIVGLLVSIYIPVLVSIISNKIKFTNFFFYPVKTIEDYKKGKI